MADYVIVNDIIEYEDDVKVGDESSEKDVAPKKTYSVKPVKKDKFKENYFVFYDDIKLTPKDDW